MWGCGLKFYVNTSQEDLDTVTPYVGVWIEIYVDIASGEADTVTPYVGVWIEIIDWIYV